MNNNTDEIWKDIIGYEGLYQISNLGRVKSLPQKRVRGFCTFISKEKILKNIFTCGYYRVTLWKGTSKNRHFIHRLIAIHFIENLNNHKIINHIDGDSSNNAIPNLEWCTQRENSTHGKKAINKYKYQGIMRDNRLKKRESWRASLNVGGKNIRSKTYRTQEEAYQAYLKLMEKHGITNKYSQPLPEKRQLWKRPYYEKASPNYLNHAR